MQKKCIVYLLSTGVVIIVTLTFSLLNIYYTIILKSDLQKNPK